MTLKKGNSNRVVTFEQLVERIKENSSALKAYGIVTVGIFGSFARGQQTSKSDVDLLVEFIPEEKTLRHFMGAAFLLERVLGRKVELITASALTPHAAEHILPEVINVSLTD